LKKLVAFAIDIMLGAQRSNAIYGETGTQNATVVPDLGAISDGAHLTVTSDSEQFNLHQVLHLNDSYYDTKTEEVYASQMTPGNVVIQGSTMGFVNMKGMFLEIDCSFSSVGTAIFGPGHQHFGVPANYNQNDDLTRAYWNLIQAEFAFLQPFNRIQISMGENNQIIQRQQMNSLPHLRQIARDNVVEGQLAAHYTQLGLPASRTLRSVPLTYSNFWANLSDIPLDIRAQWDSMIKSLSFNTGSQVWQGKFTIPLSMINSLWNQDAFLPPGLKYRIELDYNPGLVEIMRALPDGGTSTPGYGALFMTLNTNNRLVYRSHMLRQPLQKQLNLTWLKNPLLYNYETYELKEEAFDGTNIVIRTNIAISQQRPTQIFFKVLGPNTINTLTEVSPVSSNQVLSTTTFPSGTCPARFSDVKIIVAGRENYFLRSLVNQTQNNQLFLKDGTDVLNSWTNTSCYVDNGVGSRMNTSRMSGLVSEGNILVVNMNPGDIQQHGRMSTDQGAVVINVELTVVQTIGVKVPFPNTYRLVMYKKLPEQMQIDAAKNVTIISWPAVVANNGYAIANTFNSN
jgi:hypothetical protein